MSGYYLNANLDDLSIDQLHEVYAYVKKLLEERHDDVMSAVRMRCIKDLKEMEKRASMEKWGYWNDEGMSQTQILIDILKSLDFHDRFVLVEFPQEKQCANDESCSYVEHGDRSEAYAGKSMFYCLFSKGDKVICDECYDCEWMECEDEMEYCINKNEIERVMAEMK